MRHADRDGKLRREGKYLVLSEIAMQLRRLQACEAKDHLEPVSFLLGFEENERSRL